MAASYPSSVKSFTPIVDATDYPQAAQVNALYDEMSALEAALLTTGLEHNLFPESSADARTLGTSTKFWGLSYLKGVNLAAATSLTIAGGIVTNTQSVHAVDTEAAAAADDLDTITPGSGIVEGAILILRAANIAHVVTLKDGTGNLLLNGDYALSATDRTITLTYDGTNWRELARSVPGAVVTTFTPVLGGSGGTSGQTYTTQVGRAVKVGQLVHFQAYMVLSNKGTITTSLQLQGLPYTALNVTAAFGACNVQWFSLNTNQVYVSAEIIPNGTAATLFGLTAAGATLVALTTADVTNTTTVIISGTYIADA